MLIGCDFKSIKPTVVFETMLFYLQCSETLRVSMGRKSEKNDLKKTQANSSILGTFSIDINYIVIN